MKHVDVASILKKYENQKGALISMLQEIQTNYGYLPKEALQEVSKLTGQSLVDLYGVATFYQAFRLEPRGKHLLSVCLGTACHVKGGPEIAEECERQLKIKAGETTPDRKFTLETVACLGACALGPIVMADGHYFSKVTVGKVKKLIDQVRGGMDHVEVTTDQRLFPLDVSCPKCNHTLMDTHHFIDGYPSIRVTMSFERKHGWLNLSCLYGSYEVESEHTLPPDDVVNCFCPYCHAELISSTLCPECTAPMVPMIVRGGGMVQICQRRGCKGHMLDLSGVNF